MERRSVSNRLSCAGPPGGADLLRHSKQHTMNANTPAAPRRPTAGIDWASDDHAVAVVDPDGVAIKRCTFEHTGAGLRALLKALQRADGT